MAASTKPTGVHYALVFFVLATVVCLVGWLVTRRGVEELKNSNVSLDKKAKDADAAARTAVGDVDQIKKKLGSGFDQVGDAGNPNSVLGNMEEQIRNFGAGLTSPTLHDLLAKQAEALRNTTAARDGLQDKLAQELALFEQQKTELNAQLAAEKAARGQTDKDKTDADNTHSEELKKKESDIAELRKAIAQTQQEYDEYKESAEKLNKQLSQRVASLLSINNKLTAELDEINRQSFDEADGSIVWVDVSARRVWINLGEVDGLRPRTSFSVYRKDHSGVGRGSRPHAAGPDDIKGSIEVMRIMGPHQAEARILGDDIYNPIGKGDPIYSPLWSPGRGESFSIVGVMDLDGDGRSDRDLLHEIITASGAAVDNEVDDKGNLFINGKPAEDPTKPQLSERTKFVVKGKIADLTSTADKEEQAVISRINEIQREMDQQARERGIRIVSLSDFLSFMGYKTQRRLFVPGGETPFTLKFGNRAASTEKSTGSNASTGNTSSAFSEKTGKNKNFRKGADK
jgi:hypothetical protein